MSRRTLIILFFALFIGGVIWYASAHVRVPEVSFKEAAKEAASSSGDEKEKKVMVVGKVLNKEINASEGSATFYMVDKEGGESKVSYDGADALTGGQLSKAAESGSEVSIAGHSHGEYFHAKDIFLPAY
jgi:hypothetical protein